MGKPTGFMEYGRIDTENKTPEERLKNYNEFHNDLSREEQRRQGARCMNCGVPFCQSGILLRGMVSGCPLNNLIPEWNDLIYSNNLPLAINRLLLTNPFPEFTGRVCPAPCESACTLGINAPPVNIKENERFIIESAFNNDLIKPIKQEVLTGKRIAVIGSGPSGLSAAYYLNKLGHEVSVFEREDKIGGLLMYGIPNMKLDKKVIDRRVDLMREEGVKFYINKDIGKSTDETEELVKRYDAIVIATGASKPRDMTVEGRELEGIHFAVDYLKSNTKDLLNNKSERVINAKGKNVLVIGGGDTGTDCVATALRQDSRSIVQIEITSKLPETPLESNPWPEWKKIKKVDYGQQEYIFKFGKDPRVYNRMVKSVVGNSNGKVKGVNLVKVDEGFKEIPNSEYYLDVDLILIAMGFLGSEDYVIEGFKSTKDSRGNFVSNSDKIFVTGDARRGQSLVVWAIREGIEVALKVDGFLGGK